MVREAAILGAVKRMTAENPQKATRNVLALIMLGVLVWGSIHALGAYWFNYNPWRALVVMVCVVGYLGFWLLMLQMRARRKSGG
jgi:ABC-type transport system involved in Fe-S cluster assembly fused permease/ATPase subunit